MANPSGKICLGFNMENPDHKQVKKILDSLPKGAKSNFVVTAVLEYWVRHEKVIDVRDYRKSGLSVKFALIGCPDDDKLPEQLSAAPHIAAQQASSVSTNPEELSHDLAPVDGGGNPCEGGEELMKILLQGLNSFK